jgi:hypothetical protein
VVQRAEERLKTVLNSVGNLKLRGTSKHKVPLGIVPRATAGIARVLEDASVVYAKGNFLAQPLADAIEAYDSAMLRHRAACTPLSGIVTPESYASLDDDSGLPHIDHMLAGLLILRTLMIRDGVLPEDPGMGKRYRASVETPEPTIERTPIMVGMTPEDNASLLAMAMHISARDYPAILMNEPIGIPADASYIDVAVSIPETECDDVTCPYQDGGCNGCPANEPDADAARRAAAEASLKQLQVEQRAATEAKQQRDQEVVDRARVRSEGMRY